MKNYPIWKSFTVVSLVLLGIIFAIPSIIYDENSENWFLKNKINLGLDLQGGSYLLLEVQLDVLYKEELDNFVDSVRLISRDQAVKIEKIDIQENEVVVFFANKEKIKDIRDSFFQMYRGVTLQINNNKLSIKLNDEYRKIIQDSAIKQSLEIVRKRIDESGTKEPLIQRSGKKRILLQLPGVKDPERIKDLLGKTAKLTFHIVDNDNVSALQNNLAPFGKIIVPDMYDENTKYLLDKRAVVGGENLVDAKGSFDQTEGHAVSFRFDTEGAQKFGKVTTNNIGKNLAVVLDGVVITAPRISSAITSTLNNMIHAEGEFSSLLSTDYAIETTTFTVSSMIKETSLALLAQANAPKKAVNTLVSNVMENDWDPTFFLVQGGGYRYRNI